MSLLHNRAFVLLAAGQAVSAIGSQFSLLAIPLLVLDLTASPAVTGLFAALRTVPPLVLLLPAGAWVDRWDRKRVMLVSDAARACVVGSVPLALVFDAPVLPLLAMAAVVEGVFNAFFGVAENATLPNLVPAEQLPRAVSIDVTSTQLAQTVGPGLGGWLYVLSRGLPFTVDAVSYAFSVLTLLCIHVPFQPTRTRKAGRRHLLAEIRAGLAYLMHHRGLRTLVVLVGGLNFCSQGYPVLLLVRARDLGADPQTIGLLFATGGLGGLLGALVAAKLQRTFGVGTVLIVSSWVWVLTWPPFALAPSLGWLAVANAVGWIVVPIQGVTQLSYRLQSFRTRCRAASTVSTGSLRSAASRWRCCSRAPWFRLWVLPLPSA